MRKNDYTIHMFSKRDNCHYSENICGTNVLSIYLSGCTGSSSDRESAVDTAFDAWLQEVADPAELPNEDDLILLLALGKQEIGYCTRRDNDVFIDDCAIEKFYSRYSIPKGYVR